MQFYHLDENLVSIMISSFHLFWLAMIKIQFS